MPDAPRQGRFAAMILTSRMHAADKLARAMDRDPLKGDLFQDAVKATVMAGIAPSAIAQAAMVPEPTVQRWLTGKSAPDAAMRMAVRDLLTALLRELADQLTAELDH